MIIEISKDIINICKMINDTGYSIQQWIEREADDYFTVGSVSGGFDATEMEFTFTIYIKGDEYWFQMSQVDIMNVLDGKNKTVCLVSASSM